MSRESATWKARFPRVRPSSRKHATSANDEVGGNTEVLGMAMNDQDTLLVYPEGKTSGKPYRTIENMRLSTRRHSGGYQSKVEWQCSFYAYETVTDTTYTT